MMAVDGFIFIFLTLTNTLVDKIGSIVEEYNVKTTFYLTKYLKVIQLSIINISERIYHTNENRNS